MKTVFISLMALGLVLGNVNAKDSSSTNRKAVPESTAVAKTAYDRLLEENKMLREKVEVLNNEAAELKSSIEYNSMMSNMFAKLYGGNSNEKLADLQSELEYDAMMSNMFNKIRAEEKADAIADQQSLENYNRMMSSMFTNLDEQKDAEAKADKEAEAAYNKMMANMLLTLKQQKS